MASRSQRQRQWGAMEKIARFIRLLFQWKSGGQPEDPAGLAGVCPAGPRGPWAGAEVPGLGTGISRAKVTLELPRGGGAFRVLPPLQVRWQGA